VGLLKFGPYPGNAAGTAVWSSRASPKQTKHVECHLIAQPSLAKREKKEKLRYNNSGQELDSGEELDGGHEWDGGQELDNE